MYRDTTNVEPEMYDYTNNNWSHWNSNEKLKENLEAVPGKQQLFKRSTRKKRPVTRDSDIYNNNNNNNNNNILAKHEIEDLQKTAILDISHIFYVHLTVHRNKSLCNKTS